MRSEVAEIPDTADPAALLDRVLRQAIVSALGDQFAEIDPAIRPSQNPQFGDYQANAAMGLPSKWGASRATSLRRSSRPRPLNWPTSPNRWKSRDRVSSTSD